MAGIGHALRNFWRQIPTLRKVARVCIIIIVCVVTVYALVFGSLFACYGLKFKGEMKAYKAAGGTVDPASLAPSPGGEAPRLVQAAGLLYREPFLPVGGPPAENLYGDDVSGPPIAVLMEMRRSYDAWKGWRLYRTVDQSSWRPPEKPSEWDDEWLAPLERHLSENERTLALAKDAALIGKGAFEVDWNAGYEAKLSHLSTTRNLARLLRTEAVVLARKGDAAGALEDLRLIFRLRGLIQEEPTVISRLVSFAVDAIACSGLQGALDFGALDAEGLRAISRELEGREKANRVTKAFLMETAFGLQAFDKVRTDPSYIEHMGRPAAAGEDRDPYENWLTNTVIYLAGKFVWVRTADQYHYLHTMRLIREASEMPFPEALGIPDPTAGVEHINPAFGVMTRMLTPALSRVIMQEAKSDARAAQARCVIALELYRRDHGGYPAALSALVPEYLEAVPADPFDGQPMRYIKPATGFIVYSVGEDSLDQNGMYPLDDAWERED